MLKINFQAESFDFEMDTLRPAIDRRVRFLMLGAAKAFFKIAVRHIHIDTGMSLASFSGFAELVGESLDTYKAQINHYNPPKWYNGPEGGPRLFERGVPMGPTRGTTLQLVDSQHFKFFVGTGVYQFVYYEQDDEWGVFETGMQAFRKYLDEHPLRIDFQSLADNYLFFEGKRYKTGPGKIA